MDSLTHWFMLWCLYVIPNLSVCAADRAHSICADGAPGGHDGCCHDYEAALVVFIWEI